MEADMQIALDLPYDIQMSNSLYDNICHHNVALNSRHDFLGMKIGLCNKRKQPILECCLPGHTVAKLPYW